MSILIKNGTLVTMNTNWDVLRADLLIENDRIRKIASYIKEEEAAEVIHADHMLVIPGLIQTHIHLCQTLFRGSADDLELLDWLKLRIWPLEGSHDEESLYCSARLGISELIRGGTTAVIDMGTVHHTDALFTAVKESGIRYLGGKCMMDSGIGVPHSLLDHTEASLQESMDLYSRWNGQENGRIRYAFCPRFALSCSENLLRQIQLLSQQFQIPVHSHASENKKETAAVEEFWGMKNIQLFDQFHLCGPGLILAHCIHIGEEEMQILADSGTHVAHCPSSNLKLGSGIAGIPAMLNKGISVSLGADGPPCNNNLDMFNEMRMAALIQKPIHGPRSMPARQVLEMATKGGARALGMEDLVGSLEIGKKADIAVVSLNSWHTRPLGPADVYSQLVYQARSDDVFCTIVDGKIQMIKGTLLNLADEGEFKRQLEDCWARIKVRSGL